MSLNLKELQKQMAVWRTENFGEPTVTTTLEQLAGVGEEFGELSHSVLKSFQGIRVDQDHDAMGQDAVGDLCIFLMNLCEEKGWCMEECIENTAKEVLKRERKDQISRSE